MQERGLAVNTWAVPDPTLWSEHRHTSSEFSTPYTSKLGAYESMINRIKFQSLSFRPPTQALQPAASSSKAGSSTQAGSAASTQAARGAFGSQNSFQQVAADGQDKQQPAQPNAQLNVVSDFPHVQSSEARQQMCDVLAMLASSASVPTVILVTESGVPVQSHAPEPLRVLNDAIAHNKLLLHALFAKCMHMSVQAHHCSFTLCSGNLQSLCPTACPAGAMHGVVAAVAVVAT